MPAGRPTPVHAVPREEEGGHVGGNIVSPTITHMGETSFPPMIRLASMRMPHGRLR